MTQKRIFDLPIGPGQYTEQSERGAVGRWYSADKVRFRKGLVEKLGGWSQLAPQFEGTCRRLKDWTSLDKKTWTAIGTDLRLYVWQDGTLFNITPVRASGSLSAPFTTFTGETRVRVASTAHGLAVGDYVVFSNAVIGSSGVLVDGDYRVITVIDNDTFEITDDQTAGTGASGEGGASVNYLYEIPVGASSATTATGYGVARYGTDRTGWNTPATTGSTLVLGIRTWALDQWGEDLLASPRDGSIYWWDRSLGTSSRATVLGSESPVFNKHMMVSQRDRHVLALGAYDYFNDAYDPMLIRWCSTEDLNDWIPTSTNTAGDLRLYNGSTIVTGVRSRLESVIFTDTAVYTLPFVGGFDVFGLNIVGENVSILGPNCAVAIDHRVLFMAESDFYMYDGVVRVIPCDVRNFVYDNLNVTQSDKIYGGLNREFNEVWWFYPSFDTDCWIQQDFSLGLPQGYQIAQPSSGGTAGYSYVFDPEGHTEITATADNGYEYDYVLINDEPILTPREAEYAIEFAFGAAGGAETNWVGMVFLRENITGTINTTADDAQGIYIEADKFTDTIRVMKKNASGVKSVMDNDPGTTTFLAETGSVAATDTKYIFTVSVNLLEVTVYLDGAQVWQFNLSTAEGALYSGGSSGFHAAAATTMDDEVQFYNLAMGPLGCLTAVDFDISPIEVNRYVAFSYEEGTWITGKMARTAWADRSPLLEKPYAAGTDGYLYQHETGTDDNGAAMAAFIQSFDMEVPDAGEELMHIDQLIPDFLTLEGSVDVYLTGRKYPQDVNRMSKGPYTVSQGTRKLSTRIRARQVALRIESNATGDKWRMGTWRGRAGAHGKRG
jgi:hypothetical protein